MPQPPAPPVVAAGAEDAVVRAAAVLRDGGTVVLPTDTVYGLAVLPGTRGGSAAVFALKDRPAGVPLAVLLADAAQGRELAGSLPPRAAALAERWWPGPLTIVVPRRAGLDVDLGGAPGTVGLRCPDHDLVRALAAEVGPLATTSANRHGRPTPATAAEAAASLTGPVDLVLDGGPCEGEPSTVVECTGPELHLLREGAIPYSSLRAS